MGKRFAIAAGIVVVLLAAAWAVYSLVLADKQLQPSTGGPPPVPADAAAAPASAPTKQRITVAAAAGNVERQAAGAPWRPARVGDELSLDESLRTGEGAAARLDLGTTATVEVAAGAQFSVSEVTDRISRVKLSDGRVSAVVRGTGGRLRVEVGGSDATAESERGKFSVLTDGHGRVAVAAAEGRVALSARSKRVDVNAGEQAQVRPGEAPSAPEKIPSSLFVKVDVPRTLLQRRREISIRGSTASGALVSVNGVRAQVDDQGAFVAVVPLREGSNRVVVNATDVAGRRELAALPAITVDTKPPVTKSQVKW